jgi:hypothetical protein
MCRRAGACTCLAVPVVFRVLLTYANVMKWAIGRLRVLDQVRRGGASGRSLGGPNDQEGGS